MSPPRHAMREREHADPHEQYNPVPKVVLALVIGLIAWGAGYIVWQQPDGAAALGDQRIPASLTVAKAAGNTADGAQVYAAACQACHQANGQGLAGVFPPLAGSPWVLESPEQLSQILLHGLTGPISVLGTEYNGAMPAFGEQLTDAEIAAVSTHIRTQWGNAAEPITAPQIAAARAASTHITQPWHGTQELAAFLAGASADATSAP